MFGNVIWLFFDVGSTLINEANVYEHRMRDIAEAANEPLEKIDEAIMIGDRIDNDIVPANLLGIHTIWVKQGFGKYWNY